MSVSDLYTGAIFRATATEAATPDWIYHLRINRTEEESRSAFHPLADELLKRIVKRLELNDRGSQGYLAEPMEYDDRHLNDGEPRSPYAFAPQLDKNGRSFLLPLATALVGAAAAHEQPIVANAGGHVTQHAVDQTAVGEDPARRGDGRPPLAQRISGHRGHRPSGGSPPSSRGLDRTGGRHTRRHGRPVSAPDPQ